MQKIKIKDGTEIMIMQGASLENITAVLSNWAMLEELADKLTAAGNLDEITFFQEETETGKYEDMILTTDLFSNVAQKEGHVLASFGLRSKTELEKRLEKIEKQQTVQDGAILDLAGLMGGD